MPKCAQRTFEIVQKSRSHEHGDIINYIDTIALGLLKNKNTNKKECQMGKELEEYE